MTIFLLSLLAATFFIGFNLDNRCDISWVFGTFRDVPIFVSLLFAFTAGVIAAIPFKFRSRKADRGTAGSREQTKASRIKTKGHEPEGFR